MRETRRKYEEKHKEAIVIRKMTWGTSVPREVGEEINDFLAKHNIPKIDLIYAGFEILKERFDPNSECNK